ncbi:MAG: YigZ family protein [Flavobacteriaceae bacterium CG02_land_8_20_14_3_00_34_13]|nr:YigZ family protein [Flavobacteriia bacterium]PIV48921.1 MAG: YigZ family protein [Flavobacteriaceae bacterium CG02_land_8_20_14_3_00_34_13]PIZ07966.1 MAG: YigZ family protein [Flavobacteriaceae bacterium CG_4_10_14_0_8_um_filter_34_31]
MEPSDSYKTIAKPSEETLLKEKSSKFFGYAFPIEKEEDITECLETLKHKHKTARHFCYAYQLGTETIRYRVNDDGEPSNSAGMPIYGQIQSFDITNVLVVVVRYFGGTKLGVGGLISAYKTSAKETLEASEIITKTIDVTFQITFDYKNMNRVMRVIKEKQLHILEQKMALNCTIFISVRKNIAEEVQSIFESIYKVSIQSIS